MRDIVFPKKIVSLSIDDRYDYVMATTPLNPKGLPRQQKRLARIKRNVVRELLALEKELRRTKL